MEKPAYLPLIAHEVAHKVINNVKYQDWEEFEHKRFDEYVIIENQKKELKKKRIRPKNYFISVSQILYWKMNMILLQSQNSKSKKTLLTFSFTESPGTFKGYVESDYLIESFKKLGVDVPKKPAKKR